MDKLLYELKNNYYATGLKAEFESEGASYDEVKRLKHLAENVKLPLTLKIGGCGALRDIIDAKTIGVNALVAPMVESKYALNKFIQTYKSVYTEHDIDLYINIETLTGYNALDEIISDNDFKYIKGVVFGRGDMAESIGINNPEDSKLLNIGKTIREKIQDKELITGGKITAESLPFLKEISTDKFETRKIIFDKNATEESIKKAIEFELMWVKNNTPNNIKRILELEKRKGVLHNVS